MAVVLKRNSDGITNFWTQLKGVVSNKSLYNDADYAALSEREKENYLLMLYNNNDALSERLPDFYNGDGSTAYTRYAILNSLNSGIQVKTPEYQEQRDAAIDAELNKKFGASNKTWVNWMVNNKYAGDYAKFLREYSGESAKTFEDIDPSVSSEYMLDEDIFKSDIAALEEARVSIAEDYDASMQQAYSKTLETIRLEMETNVRKALYDNASAFEKTLNTIWQMPVLWAAEAVEFVEGVGDAIIGFLGVVGDLAGADTQWAESAIETDWWNARGWLTDAVPNSYLSQYAGENLANDIFQIGTNIVRIAGTAVLDTVLPGLGQFNYYASSFGAGLEQELQSGTPFDNAIVYAIGSTAIEIGTEQIFGSQFLGRGFTKFENKLRQRWYSRLAYSMVTEGVEEGLSAIGSDLWHGVTTGKYTLNTEAGWTDVLKSVVIGSVVGGLMQGGTDILNYIGTDRVQKMSKPTGETITVSRQDAIAVLEFVERTGERIERGKKVSEKTRARFEALKDLVVVVPETGFTGKILAAPGVYGAGVGHKIKLKLAAERVVKAAKDAKKGIKTVPAADGMKAIEELGGESTPSEGKTTFEFTEDSDMSEVTQQLLSEENAKDIAILQEQFRNETLATMVKLYEMYGDKALIEGVNLAIQQQNATLDRIIELANLGQKDADFKKTAKVSEETSEALSKAFPGAQFQLVDANSKDAMIKLAEIRQAVLTIRKALGSKGKQVGTISLGKNIQLFMTDKGTVANSFFIGDTLYVSADWFMAQEIGTIKDVLLSKLIVEKARGIINTSDSAVYDLLLETVNNAKDTGRSPDILLQELTYIMFLQKNNRLLQQMYCFADDAGIKRIAKYFDDIRNKVADLSVQRTVGKARANAGAAVEALFDIKEAESEDTDDSFNTLITNYQSAEFRAFPLITGKTGLPRDKAKIAVLASHFEAEYGLIIPKSGFTARTNLLKYLLDPKNYKDTAGYKKLQDRLDQYAKQYNRKGQPRKLQSELLNYYIDSICGLMVFSNGVITQQELTYKIIDFTAIEKKTRELSADGYSPREPVGTVGDFLTDYAKDLLKPVFRDVPVYAAFDSTNPDGSYFAGTPDTGMVLVVNVSQRNKPKNHTLMWQTPVLDASGKFVIEDDKVKTVVTKRTVSDTAYEFAHEIGHSIGTMLKFSGNFSTRAIDSAYIDIFSKMSVAQRKAFVAQLTEWLNKNAEAAAYIASRIANTDIKVKNTNSAKEYLNAWLKKLGEAVNSNLTENLVQPLSEYLYEHNMANELYAKGLSTAVAGKDTLYGDQMVYTIDGTEYSGVHLHTESDVPFIKILDGYDRKLGVTAATIESNINAVINTPENIIRRTAAGLKRVENIQQLKEALQVEESKKLTSVSFWQGQKSTTKTEPLGRSTLIHGLEAKYNCTYDSVEGEFTDGYISEYVRDRKPGDGVSMSYAVIGGKLVTTEDSSVFNRDKYDAFVWRNATGKLTIRIDEPNTKLIESNGKIYLRRADASPQTYDIEIGDASAGYTIIARGRYFANINFANAYIDSTIKKDDPGFEKLFSTLIEGAIPGVRDAYNKFETVYITNDGTVIPVASKLDMNAWLAKAQQYRMTDRLGRTLAKDTDEKLTPQVIDFLNKKRVVRLYKSGDTWVAYGQPNHIQDKLLCGFIADIKTTPAYLDNEVNTGIYVGDDGKIYIREKKQTKGYSQVGYKDSVWYKPICRILQYYGITNLKELAKLGFSSEFIANLRLTQSSIKLNSLVLDYITDDTNTAQSINILLENKLETIRETGTGMYGNNPTIRTIQDARRFWDNMNIYWGYLKANPEVCFYNEHDLRLAAERAGVRGDISTSSDININLPESEILKIILNYDGNHQLLYSYLRVSELLKALRQSSKKESSTDAPISEDGSTTFGAQIADEGVSPEEQVISKYTDPNSPARRVLISVIKDFAKRAKAESKAHYEKLLKFLDDKKITKTADFEAGLRSLYADYKAARIKDENLEKMYAGYGLSESTITSEDKIAAARRKARETAKTEIIALRKTVKTFKTLSPEDSAYDKTLQEIINFANTARQYKAKYASIPLSTADGIRTSAYSMITELTEDIVNPWLSIDSQMVDKTVRANLDAMIGRIQNFVQPEYIDALTRNVRNCMELLHVLRDLDKTKPGWHTAYANLNKYLYYILSAQTKRTISASEAQAAGRAASAYIQQEVETTAATYEDLIDFANEKNPQYGVLLEAIRKNFFGKPEELTEKQLDSIYKILGRARGERLLDLLQAPADIGSELKKSRDVSADELFENFGDILSKDEQEKMQQLATKAEAADEETRKEITKNLAKSLMGYGRSIKYAQERAAAIVNKIRAGRPITMEEVKASLADAVQRIIDYRFVANDKELIYEFQIDPLTLKSRLAPDERVLFDNLMKNDPLAIGSIYVPTKEEQQLRKDFDDISKDASISVLRRYLGEDAKDAILAIKGQTRTAELSEIRARYHTAMERYVNETENIQQQIDAASDEMSSIRQTLESFDSLDKLQYDYDRINSDWLEARKEFYTAFNELLNEWTAKYGTIGDTEKVWDAVYRRPVGIRYAELSSKKADIEAGIRNVEYYQSLLERLAIRVNTLEKALAEYPMPTKPQELAEYDTKIYSNKVIIDAVDKVKRIIQTRLNEMTNARLSGIKVDGKYTPEYSAAMKAVAQAKEGYVKELIRKIDNPRVRVYLSRGNIQIITPDTKKRKSRIAELVRGVSSWPSLTDATIEAISKHLKLTKRTVIEKLPEIIETLAKESGVGVPFVPQNVPQRKPFSKKTREMRYRAAQAIEFAYYQYMVYAGMDDTRTTVARDKFLLDVDEALSSGRINQRIPGSASGDLMIPFVPEEYTMPQYLGGKKFTMEDFEATVAPMYGGIIRSYDAAVAKLEELQQFGERIKLANEGLKETLKAKETPGQKLHQKILNRQKISGNIVQASTQPITDGLIKDVVFDEETGQFIYPHTEEIPGLTDVAAMRFDEDENLNFVRAQIPGTNDMGILINPSYVDFSRIDDDVWIAYLRYTARDLIARGLAEVDEDSGNLVDPLREENGKKPVIYNEYAKLDPWRLKRESGSTSHAVTRYTSLSINKEVKALLEKSIEAPLDNQVKEAAEAILRALRITDPKLRTEGVWSILNEFEGPTYTDAGRTWRDSIYDALTKKQSVAKGDVFDGIPSEADFVDGDIRDESMPAENEFVDDEDIPDEDIFTDDGVSEYVNYASELTRIGDFDLETLDAAEEQANKVKANTARVQKGKFGDSEQNTTDGVTITSENTRKILSYVPKDWETKPGFASDEFLKDADEYLKTFMSSTKDMTEFVEYMESNPTIRISSPTEFVMIALLNKISLNATVSEELRERAKMQHSRLTSRGGVVLGMAGTAVGVTPVEQLVGLCLSQHLNLSKEEVDLLSKAAKAQASAIAKSRYADADAIMQTVLEVIRKHKSELPVSMNIFARELTPEERTARWHNLAEQLTSWRYFAMLSSPTTFFTKNILSNVIITGLDTTAEKIASWLPEGKKLARNYSFMSSNFVDVPTGEKLGRITVEQVKLAIYKMVAARGIESDNLPEGVKRARLEQLELAQDIEQVKVDFGQYANEDLDLITASADKLTESINQYITARYSVNKIMPSASEISVYANKKLSREFYQYSMTNDIPSSVDSVVDERLEKTGLLDSIMRGSVTKHDRGYETRITGMRQLVSNTDFETETLSEADASMLADAVRSDRPFEGDNVFSSFLNKWYDLIFRTMEAGDKKFIKPKIIKMVRQLVAANMTAAEVTALAKGDKGALAKFNDFVEFAVEESMKTYFRGNSDFQKKLMRLFDGHPVVQIIFGTLIPFPRMLINSMRTVLQYSPAGFLMAAHTHLNDQSAFATIRRNKQLGQAFTGTVLIALGTILGAIGWLGFDKDDEFGGVKLRIGDLRLALDDLQPSTIPLIVGASMTDPNTEGLWNKLTLGGRTLLNATVLGEMIEIFGGNKKSEDVVVDTFESFVNQFMPSAFRHIARTIDPTQKKYSSNGFVKTFQRILASFPGTSFIVPTKIDPYTGEAIYQNVKNDRGWASVFSFFNAFSPAKISLASVSDVQAESEYVGAPTTGPSSVYKIDGVEYKIPDKLYREYQVLRARLYAQYTKDIINTSAYKNLTIEKKKLRLERLQEQATREARKQLNIGK